jgi:glucokinase
MAENPAGNEKPPFPLVVGDIGGTNARFALLADETSAPSAVVSVATADHRDVESAIAATLLAKSATTPRAAIIDMAGPIVGDEVVLTNAKWTVRPRAIMRALGVHDVILLNDFEALALSLPALGPGDLAPLGDGAEPGPGAKVVLGPGTGLGVGALVQAGGLWAPVPGEGGHVEFGPAEPDEFAIWPHIRPEHNRIEAESLLSGPGLLRLYRAVVASEGGAPVFPTPAAITDAALAGSDAAAVRTLSLYCRFLGRLAGDMALTFMARGGVYIGGGIPPRILPFLRQPEFRRAFEAKAPHDRVMRTIPTFVITRENPALLGLAAFAGAPESFGVTLTGRRWRT